MQIFNLIFNSSLFVQFLLLLMIMLSVLSWTIILQKYFYFKQLYYCNNKFLKLFANYDNFNDLLKNTDKKIFKYTLGKMFHNGVREVGRLIKIKLRTTKRDYIVANVERALTSTANEEILSCDKYSALLATIATVGPYLGLLGTVWGVMDSFIHMKANTNLAQIAPGIAESLISTLIGLILSIPSYIAYNYFQDQSNILFTTMAKFADDFINDLNTKLLNNEL